MSLSPAIIDAMIASGCTAAQLAAVVKASLAEQEARADEKRAKDAERQRRHRVSRNVTVTTRDERDSAETPPLSPPNDIYSNPPHDPPITKSGGRDAFPCPDWCEPAVWRDLKRNRKAKHLANTETAHRKFIAAVLGMADDEWPPGRLVEAIAARGWGGAYDPRDDRKQTNGRAAPSNRNTAELALAKLGMASG